VERKTKELLTIESTGPEKAKLMLILMENYARGWSQKCIVIMHIKSDVSVGMHTQSSSNIYESEIDEMIEKAIMEKKNEVVVWNKPIDEDTVSKITVIIKDNEPTSLKVTFKSPGESEAQIKTIPYPFTESTTTYDAAVEGAAS
jgi:hypothetical protein